LAHQGGLRPAFRGPKYSSGKPTPAGIEHLEKHPTEALAGKQPAAAVGAGGDKLQLAGLKMAPVNRDRWNVGGAGESRDLHGVLALSQLAGPTQSRTSGLHELLL